ncbi:MAG TPA: class I SAM-dependent methyltransferase [Albitalea sp.]|nr:class I SAM-dependent methyltransferase [Albitalea sp.]
MTPTLTSPFDAPARHVASLPAATLIARYREKCGVDISRSLAGIAELDLYECERTGYRFWRPEAAAGDEAFYQSLSAAWPGYYRTERWEYPAVRRWLGAGDTVLEVGCGRGWFLRSLEGRVAAATGLEFNREAIADKATRFEVQSLPIDAFAAQHPEAFDAVCTFHVLEHVVDPAAYLRSCLRALRPGGLLVVSTPNYASPKFREQRDAFDLPPHHVNHFDRQAYQRIAQALGLSVVAVREHPRQAEVPGNATWLRRMVGRAKSAWYRLTRAPGDTILVAFRK